MNRLLKLLHKFITPLLATIILCKYLLAPATGLVHPTSATHNTNFVDVGTEFLFEHKPIQNLLPQQHSALSNIQYPTSELDQYYVKVPFRRRPMSNTEN